MDFTINTRVGRKVMATIRYFRHDFIHKCTKLIYLQYSRPPLFITFCQMRRCTSSACPSLSIFIRCTAGSEVRGFKPGRGRWISSERKNPEYDFLRKGSKAVGPVS